MFEVAWWLRLQGGCSCDEFGQMLVTNCSRNIHYNLDNNASPVSYIPNSEVLFCQIRDEFGALGGRNRTAGKGFIRKASGATERDLQ